MLASAGNLDDLVGLSFSSAQFVALTVTSFAQTADGTVVDMLTQVLSVPATLAAASPGGSTYTVAAVTNGANQISLNQFGSANSASAFVQTVTYNVVGYNAQSVLVSTLSLAQLIAALQGASNVGGIIGAIATGVPPNGSNLGFSPNGTFVGSVACFALGTRILTESGEVPVEAIRVGDIVPGQVSGTMRRVVWVGRRTVQVARHPTPWDVAPVRVCAGALAPGQPHRDLVLSPDHAVLVEGALVPVRYLINGATVVQFRVEAVTYLHVELDRHDVLLAEGLPCESFLDTGNRAAFAAEAPMLWAMPRVSRPKGERSRRFCGYG